ncbi:MAG: pyrroline-5-carboxylate reductase [Pseudomonadota bacterium]|nr:pyrroline-5-carboxylate reductase [Pseudomonadota bacterium]
MILGFIGTGKISSSIVYGIFKSKFKIKKIYISSRNINIAKKLAKKFKLIKVLNDNQDIINKSSVIFLGVTPNVGSKILPKLRFSKNKKVISLISTMNLEKLKKLIKVKNIVRATPLPPIEIKKGPIIICPPSKFAKNIFKHLGKVLEIRNEKLSYKFWSTASLMAAFYEILNTSSKWLMKKGIKKKLADTYIAELFLALSQDALNKSSQGYKKLVADSQTPKGLNMQVLNELKKGKFFTKFTKALENVNKRVSKK